MAGWGGSEPPQLDLFSRNLHLNPNQIHSRSNLIQFLHPIAPIKSISYNLFNSFQFHPFNLINLINLSYLILTPQGHDGPFLSIHTSLRTSRGRSSTWGPEDWKLDTMWALKMGNVGLQPAEFHSFCKIA